MSSSEVSILVAVCLVWCSEVRELQLKLLDSISIMETLPSLSQRLTSGTWPQESGSMTLLSGFANTSELQYSKSKSNTVSYRSKSMISQDKLILRGNGSYPQYTNLLDIMYISQFTTDLDSREVGTVYKSQHVAQHLCDQRFMAFGKFMMLEHIQRSSNWSHS